MDLGVDHRLLKNNLKMREVAKLRLMEHLDMAPPIRMK
jgi:hypothetical protein